MTNFCQFKWTIISKNNFEKKNLWPNLRYIYYNNITIIINTHNIERFKQVFQLQNLSITKHGNFDMDDYHFNKIVQINI